MIFIYFCELPIAMIVKSCETDGVHFSPLCRMGRMIMGCDSVISKGVNPDSLRN